MPKNPVKICRKNRWDPIGGYVIIERTIGRAVGLPWKKSKEETK